MMKVLLQRTLVLVAAVGACVLTAWGQREYSPNFSLGVKGGVTLSSVAFTPEVHQTMRQGMLAGVTARYTEERFFGLIGELQIVQRGWDENFARDEAPQFSYSRTLTYVSLPLLTHIYFGSRRLKGFVNLGPVVEMLIGDSSKANFDWREFESIDGFPQRHRTNEQLRMPVENKFDYGIAAGAGMEFFINRRNSVLVEGRYYFGLGNIYGASKRDFFAGSRNTSVEVSVGYFFRLM